VRESGEKEKPSSIGNLAEHVDDGVFRQHGERVERHQELRLRAGEGHKRGGRCVERKRHGGHVLRRLVGVSTGRDVRRSNADSKALHLAALGLMREDLLDVFGKHVDTEHLAQWIDEANLDGSAGL